VLAPHTIRLPPITDATVAAETDSFLRLEAGWIVRLVMLVHVASRYVKAMGGFPRRKDIAPCSLSR